ncbi:MAG: transposase [Actinomycetota bacterium]
MYKPTSPQRSLFSVEHRMDPAKRARLERSWAHQYRSHALPLIDESRFAQYFDPENGRPNKSVRQVVSVLVLKEVFDLTDEEALENLEWNAAWQYALDVTEEEAHACQKTLHNFRTKVVEDDEGAGLFEGTTARLIEASGVRTKRQRQDSTHIVSNIKLLTRLGLFVGTLTVFLKALRDEHPRLCGGVDEAILERYLDREGYFADARGSEAPRRLADATLDVYRLVTLFEGHRQVGAMESFKLLARLYAEQCVPPETDRPERIELQERPSSSSLQSPSDPDVTYGHKGKGYEVQLTETCVEENPFQVVTAVGINGANESDQHQVEAALEQTERTCGAAPEEMHADAGYGSGENIVAAREHGTELLAPIGAKESEKHLPLSEFEFDAAGERVLRCPAGQEPVHQKLTRSGTAMLAYFAAPQCCRCPMRKQCPTGNRYGQRVLKFDVADVAVARRRVEQKTAMFKDRHKIRSGIEATNSELKRGHGFGKLRVRRWPRVGLSVRLKVLALNIKRYVGYLTEMATETRELVPACSC